MNWRYLASVFLLSLGVLLTLPFAFSQASVNLGVVVIAIALPLAAWSILLYPKGGWFNFSPLINPQRDAKHRLFFRLLLSSAMALEWSLVLISLFWYITPTFSFPAYYGPFPNPLVYLQSYDLRSISPGALFVTVFILSYIFIARRQDSVKKAGLKVVYPFLLAGFIPVVLYILSATAQMGIGPSAFALVLFVVVILGVPYYLRTKRLASWFLSFEMLAYAVYGFILLIPFEGNILPTGVALSANIVAFSLAIALAHFEDVCRQDHHIIDSFSSLGKLRKLGPLIVPVALFGVFYTSYELVQYGSVQLARFSLPGAFEFFGTSTNLDFPLFFFLLVLVWSYAVLLGNKVSQPISYGVLIVFFFLGMFFISNQSILGIWNLGWQGSVAASLASLALFYEPVNNFVTANYVRLPEKLSINYWLSRSRLLHARYRPISEIGIGGFARVVRVFDVHSGKELALKQAIVKFDNASPPSEEKLKTDIDSSIDKINFENTVLSNCHFPLIVGVADHFQEGTNSPTSTKAETVYLLNQFMAEEFVDGITLDNAKSTGARFTEDQVRYYLKRILLALNYLHQHEILHRDLTPGNVMIVRSTNDIKIIDLGLAKKTHAIGFATRSSGVFGTQQTGVVGTEGYYAPELLTALDTETGIEMNEKFDVYSAGAIGFYLATLTTPPNLQALVEKSKNPSFDLGRILESRMNKAGLSPQFTDVIRKAMAFDQKDRYATAFEFYAALSGLKGTFTVTDVGEIHKLDPTRDYTIQYQPYRMDRGGSYDFAQNVGREMPDPIITMRTSKGSGAVGKLSYDSGQSTFKLMPSQASKYYSSPRSGQGKPIEHTSFFLLRNGSNVFVTYKSVGLIRFLSRNYIPDGVFRYFEVN